MIRYPYPFRVEKTKFETEWNAVWSPDEVPYINKKWGDRVLIPWPWPPYLDHCCWFEQTVIDEIVRNNDVIYLDNGFLHSQLEEIRQSLCLINEPRVLITFQRYPIDWPENVRVIVTEPMAYQISKALRRSNIRPKYMKDIKGLEKSFGIILRGLDYGRPQLALMLKKLGLLDRALYSVGDLSQRDFQYIEDDLSVNHSDISLCETDIGGDGYIKQDLRHNFEKNLKVMVPQIESCVSFISVAFNPLRSDWSLCVSEKEMWGVITGTPSLCIYRPQNIEQMESWGYKIRSVPTRQSQEKDQQAVVRWCKEIMMLEKISRDSDWAQHWYNARAKDTADNHELTRNLCDIIEIDIQRQIDELPREFARL